MKINRDRLPDDSVNIPKESLILTLIKLSISLALSVALIFAGLKILVDISVDSLSDKEAAKLLKAITPTVHLSKSEDKNLSKVAERVFECAKIDLQPKLFIINSKRANAFAFGDGNIYITKPLLKKIDADDELAFVIGHEIAHFKHKDHLKKLGLRVILLALSALGLDLNNFILSNTLNLEESKYSQKAEIDADRFGLEVLECSYGRVDGALSIFNKLKLDNKTSNYLFASHPSFEKRLKLIKRWQREHQNIERIKKEQKN